MFVFLASINKFWNDGYFRNQEDSPEKKTVDSFPQNITKTCLYNSDPLKPHFYIVKLGFPGVYIIFLYLLKNIDCGYSLEPPRRVPTIYVLSRNMKNIRFLYLKIFNFFGGNIFSTFE